MLFPTCSVGVELDKQGIFAQTATEEESSDVVSRSSHRLQNVKRAELRRRKETDPVTRGKRSDCGDCLGSPEVTGGRRRSPYAV